VLKEPLDIRAGVAFVPERPGLGVELDEDKIKRYRVDR
jgi:L-alanine-DL-glutamate epimerase-like enolase superfamily enzyme